MRIKLLKKILITGQREPLPAKSVIESTDAHTKAEFKVLVDMGYAVETKEALTERSKGDAPENKSITGPDEAKTNSDKTNSDKTVPLGEFDPAPILAGKVEDVVAALENLPVEDLIVLRAAEVAGKNRAGVLEAVDEYDLGNAG